MEVAHFLSTISTPVVQSGTIAFALGKTRLFNTKSQWEKQRLMQNTTTHIGTTLEALPPFYVDRKDKVKTYCHESCHCSKTSHVFDEKISKLTFLKRRKGLQSTWDKRTALSKQKRCLYQNNQRHTHQPQRQKENDLNHSFRKKYAEEVIKHKFCHFAGINCCGGSKCKLDCYNADFQKFLKQADLYLLKDMSRIAKRGLNLDSIIKAQILTLFTNEKNSNTLENTLKTVKQTILNNLNKNLLKKFERWSKQMFQIMVKIQNRKTNIQTKTKNLKSFNQSIQFSVSKFKRIMGAQKTKVNKKKDITQNLKKTKVRINKNGEDKQLSVIGSKIDTQRHHQLNTPQKQSFRINPDDDEDLMRAFEAKFKSRVKNRNRHSQTTSKRKIKNPNYGGSSLKIQVADGDDDDDQTAAAVQLQLNQKINDKQIERFTEKSSSTNSIEDERPNEAQQRLKLFERLISQGIVKSRRSKSQHSQISIAEGLAQQKNEVDQHFHHYQKARPKVRPSNLKKSFYTSAMVSPSNAIKSIMKMKTRKIIQIRPAEKNARSKKNINAAKKQLTNKKISVINPKNKLSQFKTIIEKQQKQLKSSEPNTVLKQVHENSCLISKIEQILNFNGLKQLIVKQNDSVLTQKRKIRAIMNNAQAGNVQVLTSELQKYFAFFIKKIKPYCSQDNRNALQQNKNTDPNEKKDCNIEEIITKFTNLKFYQLRATPVNTEPITTKQIPYYMQTSPLICSDQVKKDRNIEAQQQNIHDNKVLFQKRKFLGQLENYVTEKQHTPFDFYHYLQLGNSIALRKYYKERNEYFKEVEHPCKRTFLQKQLQSSAFQNNSLIYS